MHQLALIRSFKNAVANLLTMGEQAQTPLPLRFFHGRIIQTSMAALRAHKAVVLSAHQGMTRLQAAHGEHPKQLLLKGCFVDPSEIGQGEASPTQAKRAGALGASDADQLDHLVPVGDLLIGQKLHRSTGNDRTDQRS